MPGGLELRNFVFTLAATVVIVLLSSLPNLSTHSIECMFATACILFFACGIIEDG